MAPKNGWGRGAARRASTGLKIEGAMLRMAAIVGGIDCDRFNRSVKF